MARIRKASAPSNNAAMKADLPPMSTTPVSPSKIARVIALLQRSDGASLAELIENTGWLPHTVRAALTGLRKKGHAIDKLSREGVTAYSIKAA